MARGRKTGGRHRGTPNKATIERALIAARNVADARVAAKKLAKEVPEDLDWDHRSCAQKELECQQSLLSPPSLPSPAPPIPTRFDTFEKYQNQSLEDL
jgi:hypothetical protein